MKETKLDMAKRLFSVGDIKGSLGVCKTLRFGFTSEEKRAIEIAHESLTGNENFYKELGVNTESMISKAKKIITGKYTKQS